MGRHKERLREIESKLGMLLVGRNEYRLSAGDSEWIYANLQLTPKRFIRGLVRRRFDHPKKSHPADRGLANACFKFVEKNAYEFEKNDRDRKAMSEFIDAKGSDSGEVIQSFHRLWCGFDSQDEAAAIGKVTEEKKRVAALAEQFVAKSSRLLREAQRNRARKRVARLRENHGRLREIQASIDSVFERPTNLVVQLLKYETWFRRHSATIALPNDFTSIEFQLRFCDPAHITFPLRFLAHCIPAGLFDGLRRKWSSGATQKDLVLLLEGTASDERVYGDLLAINERLVSEGFIDRTSVIEEIKRGFANEMYLSTAVIGVTQLEGVIWSFCRYLNGKNIRVFKEDARENEKRLYKWDLEQSKYEREGRRFAVHNWAVHSVVPVLSNSRLSAIVPKDLRSYLLDELSINRNQLAHGDPRTESIRVDAIASFVCLWATLRAVDSWIKTYRRKKRSKGRDA